MDNYKEICIQEFSSTALYKRYLLVCNGVYYEVSVGVVELLKCLQECKNEKEAIETYQMKNNKYSIEEVKQLIVHIINPVLNQKVKKGRTFLYEKEVLSAASIDCFSDIFRFLLSYKWMLLFMTLVSIWDIYILTVTENLLIFDGTTDAYVIIGMLVFMLLSSLLHELGHASACKFYGIHHGGIGFGLYLTFPVLYTDVTGIWRLNRRQRCIVNIAGVYFQMYILAILLAIFVLTENDMIRYVILMVNLGFLMTLNPFFKFDGYWIVSDILGIPNLRKRSKELVHYYYCLICKRIVTDKPYLLKISPGARLGLLIYSVVVNLFMGYYFCYIIPEFIINFVQSFPSEVHQLVLYLSNGMTPSFALLRNLVLQLLFMALIGYMVYCLIRRICIYVNNRKR